MEGPQKFSQAPNTLKIARTCLTPMLGWRLQAAARGMLVRAAGRRRKEAALASTQSEAALRGKRQSMVGLRRKASMGAAGFAQVLSSTATARKGPPASVAARKSSGVPAEALSDSRPPVPLLVGIILTCHHVLHASTAQAEQVFRIGC